ncbi:hypothetical protein CPB85DRAFT_218208 [Mucidula mucida]|nr:hypothetical protein CPB85DRAFT_218208 [Mucidula mucida]
MSLYTRDERTMFAYSSLRSSLVTVPQELVDLILECLASTCGSNDTTLRSCALVCRAWTRSSQRVLFRRVRVYGYTDMSGLLSHFRSFPHLAAFTRNITIRLAARNSIYEEYPTDIYIACLEALSPLLTNATGVEASFGPDLWNDDEENHEVNQAFLAFMYKFIHTSPVTELVLSGPCELASVATLCKLLQDSGIKRLTFHEWDAQREHQVTETLPFPCIEFLRLSALQQLWGEVFEWTSFLPNLKHLEVSVWESVLSDFSAWPDILEEDYFPSVELESLTFEVVSSCTSY